MAYTHMAIPTQCLNNDWASSSCPVLELKGLTRLPIQSSYVPPWDGSFKLIYRWPFGVLSVHDSVFPERIN